MNSRLGPGGRGFDAAYTGLPPWDIGRPQQAYVELVQTGKIHGSVLDVGCGTSSRSVPRALRRQVDREQRPGSPRSVVCEQRRAAVHQWSVTPEATLYSPGTAARK